MTLTQFTKKYIVHAITSEKESGINHLFTLAQASLESNNAKSAPGNNFFGIKATKNTPPHQRQLLRTKEILNDDKQAHRFPEVISITQRPDGKWIYTVRDWFRKYDTPEECFTDHARLFHTVARYHKALIYKNDPYRFADEIAKAGYATAPRYATALNARIKQLETLKNDIS